MTNKYIAKDNEPYDFEDGLLIEGKLLSGPQGATLVGTAQGPLNTVINNLRDVIVTGATTDAALTENSTAPTPDLNNNSSQLATTAFVTNNLINVSNTPVLSSITPSNLTTSGATFTASVINTKGYTMTTVSGRFQITRQADPNAFAYIGTAAGFVSLATPFTVNATGLLNNTSYFARLVLTDSNNLSLFVTSPVFTFTTSAAGGGAGDSNSSFDIVGATYTTTNVNATNAVVSNTTNSATAIADNAFATSIEIAQQSVEPNFTSITPVVSFRPSKLNILSGSTTSELNLNNPYINLAVNNTIYTVEAGTLFKRTVSSIKNNVARLNQYRSQNPFKTTTVNTLGAFTTNSNTPFAISGHQVVVTSSRVYVLGGRLSSGLSSNSVYYAPIDANGVIGAWVQDTNNLPSVYSYSQAVVTNNRVYLVGGLTVSAQSTIYTATIDANGVIGAWSTSPVSIGYTVYNHTCFVTNSRLYITGGVDQNGFFTLVFYAPINADGTIGTFVSGTQLPAASTVSNSVVFNNRVYLLGNNSSSNSYTAPIDPNGVVGTWSVASLTNYPTNYAVKIVVTSGRIFIYSNSQPATAIINADNTFGSFTNITVPTPKLDFEFVVTNSRIYMIGGTTTESGGALTNTLFSTPFADGWTGVNDTSPIAVSYLNNYSTQNINKVSTISTLGNWIQDTTNASLPGSFARSFITSSRVYALGGTINNSSGVSTLVYNATVNSAGVVGPFVNTGNVLPTGILSTALVTTSSRVYLLGGATANSTSNTTSTVTPTPGPGRITGNRIDSSTGSNVNILVQYIDPALDGSTGSGGDGRPYSVNIVYLDSSGNGQVATFRLTSSSMIPDGGANSFQQTSTGAISFGVDSGFPGAERVIFTYTPPTQTTTTFTTTVTAAPISSAAESNIVYTATINPDGTIGTWTNAGFLPNTVRDHQSVVVGNYLYIIGGTNSSGTLRIVYRGTINNDGTIGSWINSNNDLPISFNISEVFITSSRVYILGTLGSATSIAYYAIINADNTLGAWAIVSSFLPDNSINGRAIVTKDRVYIVNAFLFGSNGVRKVYTAPIDSNGIVGAWTEIVNNLPITYNTYPAIVTSSRIYSLTPTVYYTPFADGWVGVNNAAGNNYRVRFTSALSTVPTAVYKAGQFVQSSLHLNEAGYLNSYSNQNVNKVSTVSVLGSFTTSSNFPVVINAKTIPLITSSRIYVLPQLAQVSGGVTYYAPIDSNGVIGTWVSQNNGFPSNAQQAAGFITTNRAYALFVNSLAVYTANIDSNGVIDPVWTNSNNDLIYPNSDGVQLVVVKTKVYLFGGPGDGRIQTANINLDGTLSAWVNYSSPSYTPVVYTNLVVTSSRVYILGGNDGTQALINTRYAPINPDGTLGTWVNGSNLPTRNEYSNVVVTKDRVFLIGGRDGQTNGGANYSAIHTASIDANGVIGNWSTTANPLSVTFRNFNIAVTNSRIYLISGIINGANNSAIYQSLFADGWVGLNNTLQSSTNFVTDTIASETISNDLVTMTCNNRAGNGRYVQMRIGMNAFDVSTELKATLTTT